MVRRQEGGAKLREAGDEEPGARGGHRRRRGRRLDPLSSDQKGLVGRGADRAQGADLGRHLARRRSPAAVQHELFGRPDPQILGRALQDARGGDGPGRRVPPGHQHPPRAQSRPHGRVPPVCERGGDDRGPGRVPDPAAGQGDLAAVQHRRGGRRDPPPGGRLHPAGRRHPGDGEGRPRRRRRDLPPDQGHRDRTEAVRRMAGQDRPGRRHVRARGVGDRQLRAPDRRHGRARRAGHPGRSISTS